MLWPDSDFRKSKTVGAMIVQNRQEPQEFWLPTEARRHREFSKLKDRMFGCRHRRMSFPLIALAEGD